MKPTGKAVAAQAILHIGNSYAQEDCQALIENCVRECGGLMAYAGSNDMARYASAWMGTLEDAVAKGKLVPGAGLLIHTDAEDDLPARYRGDGLGDFSHVGLYVGKDALMDTDKNGSERACDVVHSSATMGRVAGSTLGNGWTHVIWFREIDYGADVEQAIAPIAKPVYVRVETANGQGVRIRERPERGAITKYTAPEGERLRVLSRRGDYYQVMYNGRARWVNVNFVVRE